MNLDAPNLEKPIKTIGGNEKNDYDEYIVTGSHEYIVYIPGRRMYGIIWSRGGGSLLYANYGNGNEHVSAPSASVCNCFKISDVPELNNIRGKQFQDLRHFSDYVSKYVTIYDGKFYRTIREPEPIPEPELQSEDDIKQLGKIVINASGKYKIFDDDDLVIKKGHISFVRNLNIEKAINLFEVLDSICE